MLKLYNTLTKKKEIFRPLEKGIVTMYNCGLTVYDYAHIGNLRAFMFADILRKYLEYKGFTVKQVMNFTDVGHMFEDVDIGEDKLEAAAKREKKDPWSIAEFYIKVFLEDSQKMNFEEPMVRPRATDHINEMVELIQKLTKNGYAYVVKGSVYFDVAKFKDYGKLSGNTIEKLKTGAGGRAEFNPDKRSQIDFALWINDPNHIMNWKSPWCERGYPGWHIECSVMAIKYLGETIDIHTGGVDNLFPHHENEIAQSEAATGKQFVRYWLHNEHLLVEGGRMAKSLGNFYTLGDLTAKGYDPNALRYLLLSTHYRQQLNFTFEGLEAAKNAVDRLITFMHRLMDADGRECGEKAKELMSEVQRRFEEAMDDDLNISVALAALFDFVREVNRLMDDDMLSEEEADEIYELMMKFDKVLGLIGEVRKKEKLSKEADELIRKREEARKAKDWKAADEIREKLKAMGIIVEDTPKGPRLKIKRKS
ncbi:MAG: cysteine--tRNA ligase [Candidatus Bathyarchaeota archaeon]|nr:cysteine--tRNA ligase [Candidatus Bathyarchaeota archaeon]MDH5747600.1 cysteine--tRNA ligase [Candidatus Bathyarchaeota archaeon]